MVTNVWRNDTGASPEKATPHSVVVAAEDKVGGNEYFTALVKHVFAFPEGQGFMPSSAFVLSRRSLWNGEVIRGTSIEQWLKAKDIAIELANERLERMGKE